MKLLDALVEMGTHVDDSAPDFPTYVLTSDSTKGRCHGMPPARGSKRSRAQEHPTLLSQLRNALTV